MVCCLLCFGDGPVEGDNYAQKPNVFQMSMKDAICGGQPLCCVGFFCAPCAATYTRHNVLDGKLDKYRCCQG
jgi:hypothetical protein